MYNHKKLEGYKGQPVIEWWREVFAWARSLPVVLGPNVRARQSPFGLDVTIKTDNPVSIFFEVGINGATVSVTPGRLDGLVPYIYDGGSEWISLDGYTPEGDRVGRYPVIDLEDARPGENGRTAIVLAVDLGESRELPTEEELAANPDRLVVGHRSDISLEAYIEADRVGRPFHVLALLYWVGDRVDRVGQVAMHNKTLISDTDGESERYWFAAE